jgi:hypothetical protein
MNAEARRLAEAEARTVSQHGALWASRGMCLAEHLCRTCTMIADGLEAFAAAAVAQAVRAETQRCVRVGKWFMPEDQHGTFAEALRREST